MIGLSPPLMLDPSDFLMGDPILDVQHRTLITSINELYDARFNGSSKEHFTLIVDRLVKETINHFSEEESEMIEVNYPGYEDHVEAHRLLLEESTKFLHRFDQGEDVASELQTFLFDWLSIHIRASDQDFIKYRNNLQSI